MTDGSRGAGPAGRGPAPPAGIAWWGSVAGRRPETARSPWRDGSRRGKSRSLASPGEPPVGGRGRARAGQAAVDARRSHSTARSERRAGPWRTPRPFLPRPGTPSPPTIGSTSHARRRHTVRYRTMDAGRRTPGVRSPLLGGLRSRPSSGARRVSRTSSLPEPRRSRPGTGPHADPGLPRRRAASSWRRRRAARGSCQPGVRGAAWLRAAPGAPVRKSRGPHLRLEEREGSSPLTGRPGGGRGIPVSEPLLDRAPIKGGLVPRGDPAAEWTWDLATGQPAFWARGPVAIWLIPLGPPHTRLATTPVFPLVARAALSAWDPRWSADASGRGSALR